MTITRNGVARWIGRVAASAAGVWFLALAVKVTYTAADIPLVVPLPEPQLAAFMGTMYLTLRFVALRFIARPA